MESHGRRMSLGTSVGIVVIISCCIAGNKITGVCCDVPDDVVYTDLQKTVRLGGSVLLKCQFRGTPLAIYWKKGDDPRTAPNLVSWIPGDPVTGLCEGKRPCQIMEMNEDFSLTIKEVSIAEQGRYICRVSSYKGILIHNFTDISVFSPPLEPYPTIKECNDTKTSEGYDCAISTHGRVTITCSASDFYPYLHLFFLRGSEKIPITEIEEWTNDGTRSKSVSISAVPHDTPYVCIASDVPGNEKERAVTVLVTPLQNDTYTSKRSTAKPPKEMIVVITVPVVLVTIAAVVMLIVCWRKYHKIDRRNDEEDFPLIEKRTLTGKLSFYDLWIAVSKVTASDMGKLYKTIQELGFAGKGPQKTLTHRKAYEHLCKWKTDHEDGNHLQILKAAIKKSGYTPAWKEICGLRRKQQVIDSEGTLEHILWEIGDAAKIHSFLSKLIPGRITSDLDVIENNISSEHVQTALGELKEWSKGPFDVHQFVLLSLALEKGGCFPVDRTFFAVTDRFISAEEVNHFVKKLTGRHGERLSNLVKLTPQEITTIVDENNKALFDTESMINDWVAQQNCNHVETRYKLNNAAISIGRHDLKGHFTVYDDSIKYSETGLGKDRKLKNSKEGQRNVESEINVTDAELQRIVKYAEPTQISQIFGNGGDSFGVIKAWIEEQSKAQRSVTCRDILRQQLKRIGMEDVIPLEIKEDIYLVELADVALRLLMTDVFQLGSALNISSHKMKSYHRMPMDESNLSKGTIKVLVKICKGKKIARSQLCGALSKVDGCEEIAQLLKYGHEVSQGDLSAVECGDKEIKEQEKCAKISENLEISTVKTNTRDVLQYWRSLIKPPAYNHRTVLADAVLNVLGKEKALSILSGKNRGLGSQGRNVIYFIRDSISYGQASRAANIFGVEQSSSDHGKLSTQQLFSSYQESLKNQLLNDDARKTLCRRLYEGGFKSCSSKLPDEQLQESQTTDVLEQMEKAMENDVTTRLAEILGVKLHTQRTSYVIKDVLDEWQEKIRKKPMEQQERIGLSNKLFKEGYMEFSLEIMIGFEPKPTETIQNETTVKETRKALTHSGTHHSQPSPGIGGFGNLLEYFDLLA